MATDVKERLAAEEARLVASISLAPSFIPRQLHVPFVKRIADEVYAALLSAGPDQWVRMERPANSGDLDRIRMHAARHVLRGLPAKRISIGTKEGDPTGVYFGLVSRTDALKDVS